jgi:FkbM family methyltransferase
MQIINTLCQIKTHDSVHPIIAFRNYLIWQYWRIFNCFPRMISFSNSKLLVEKHGGVAILIYIFGLYDFNNFSLLEQTLSDNPNDIFFDIGANIGSYSLIVSETKAKVVAFEPHPTSFKQLETNIKINGYQNITAINMAISDHFGEERFTDFTENTLNHLDKIGPVKVKCLTLDSFLEEYPNNQLIAKIDVEGSEFAVLKGFTNNIKRCRLLLVEHGNRSEIVEFLNHRGFKGPLYYHTHQKKYLSYPQKRPEDEVFLNENYY